MRILTKTIPYFKKKKIELSLFTRVLNTSKSTRPTTRDEALNPQKTSLTFGSRHRPN